MHIITDERCAIYSQAGHPERPARILSTLERLRGQSDLPLQWLAPLPVEEQVLLRAHTAEHLEALKRGDDFDGETPGYPEIYHHAVRSVGGALHALKLARDGKLAFTLLRPPGHHATRNHAMGFCYLNNAAIAALEAQATGTARVAVYDFDVHHGNGTEAILVDRPNTALYSIHQHPCYPGTGTENVGSNCFNYPVAPQTPRAAYRETLSQALDDLKKFKPNLVIVSAGFDAYARDPIAQETLETEDYHWLGQQVRKLELPTFSLLEGGYGKDLPELIFAYLKGWAGK